MKLDEAMSQDMTGRYADELIDSAAEPWHETAEVRMPNAELYNPLARLWQLEELDEQCRADNELHHELMNHAQDCTQTHYYWAQDKKVPCCTGCMLDINRLYGARQYFKAQKEAA